MAAKKRKKRSTPKAPAPITGKDAFMLSFVARHGVPTAEQRKEVEQYLTPHVARAAFSGSSSKKRGRKTLSQLRSLAESNTYSRSVGSVSRKRVGLSGDDAVSER